MLQNDTPVNNIAGPTAGYTITYSPSNLQITGTTPSLIYAFAHSVALNTGYQWVGGVVPTVTNASGTLTVAGTYPVGSTIGQPGQSTVELSPTNPVATLDVTYNIIGDNVWSPAGNLNGTQESGASPFFYNFDTYANGTPTITIPATYQFDIAPSTNPSPITPAPSMCRLICKASSCAHQRALGGSRCSNYMVRTQPQWHFPKSLPPCKQG